jgi:hypothetical protein
MAHSCILADTNSDFVSGSVWGNSTDLAHFVFYAKSFREASVSFKTSMSWFFIITRV